MYDKIHYNKKNKKNKITLLVKKKRHLFDTQFCPNTKKITPGHKLYISVGETVDHQVIMSLKVFSASPQPFSLTSTLFS